MEKETKADEQETAGKVWPYLVSGAVLGSIAGILFAPQAGKETRQKVSDWLKERRETRTKELLAKKQQIVRALEAGKAAYHLNDKKEERLLNI